MSPYKYFSDAEVAKFKLDPRLWTILNLARSAASVPFIVTSGLRTKEQNDRVGGKENSAHLRGLAVDLYCIDPIKRSLIIKGLFSTATPCFIEIARKHIHIDIDSSIHQLGSIIISGDD